MKAKNDPKCRITENSLAEFQIKIITKTDFQLPHTNPKEKKCGETFWKKFLLMGLLMLRTKGIPSIRVGMATGPAPDPSRFWRGKFELTGVGVGIGVGFSPIAKFGFGFGVGDGILNTRPESVPEPVPLIINIYNILKYETIRLNFMLVLNWILCFI